MTRHSPPDKVISKNPPGKPAEVWLEVAFVCRLAGGPALRTERETRVFLIYETVDCNAHLQ
jgi:hypothetical protein